MNGVELVDFLGSIIAPFKRVRFFDAHPIFYRFCINVRILLQSPAQMVCRSDSLKSGAKSKEAISISLSLSKKWRIMSLTCSCPLKQITEVKSGKKKSITRKFYPGYIFVKMRLYDDDGNLLQKPWYFVREAQGVINFVGGDRPSPLKKSRD